MFWIRFAFLFEFVSFFVASSLDINRALVLSAYEPVTQTNFVLTNKPTQHPSRKTPLNYYADAHFSFPFFSNFNVFPFILFPHPKS